MPYHHCWFPFPCGSAGQESARNAGDLGSILGFNPWVGKIPWRRERLPPPVFWPGEFHGLYSPWGRKESDFHFHFHQCYNKLLQIQCHDTDLLLYSSRSQRSKVGLSRLTVRHQQSCLPSGGSRGESVSCLSQLLEAAYTPWLMAPSSIFKASNGGLSPSHAAVSLVSLSYLLLPLLRALEILLDPPG